MNSRFVIPAAVAGSLHAVLFFGFPTVNPPTDSTPHHPIVPTPAPRDPIIVEWSPAPDDPPAPTPRGVPPEPRPEIPEPPARDPTTEIAMSATIPHPRPTAPTVVSRIEPFTDSNGTLEGIGPDNTDPISYARLDNPPRPRSQIAPVYPYEAQISGRAGDVMVEFVVDETGRVMDPHVLRSSDAVFESPTLRAVAKWRFEPGRRSGRVVRFRMAVPVAFAVNP